MWETELCKSSFSLCVSSVRTKQSRGRTHEFHKGLWVIGNPDGRTWASRRRWLPQILGTKHTRCNVNGAHLFLNTTVSVHVCVKNREKGIVCVILFHCFTLSSSHFIVHLGSAKLSTKEEGTACVGAMEEVRWDQSTKYVRSTSARCCE